MNALFILASLASSGCPSEPMPADASADSSFADSGQEDARTDSADPRDASSADTAISDSGPDAPDASGVDDAGPPTGTVTAVIEASRTECVSPCTVVFSAEESTDSSASSESEALRNLGFHFNFGDPGSPPHSVSGADANTQIGGFLAAHTFLCAAGQCRYRVGVRAQNRSGDLHDAFVEVRVDSPAARFSASDTICVSAAGDFGGDIPCPEGATQMTALPAFGSYSGKRLLLRRGEEFENLCIGYSQSNILVEPFGDSADARPTFPSGTTIDLGVDGGCGDLIINTEAARAVNASGGWISNVTITGLRVARVKLGMSYNHLGMHDLDMDFSDEASGGELTLSSLGPYCSGNDDLDCTEVPFAKGVYVSRVVLRGSRASPPVVNIGAFDCAMVHWAAVIDTSARYAVEHNLRFQGQYRLFIGHSEFLGDHVLDGKQKLTLRGCGITDLDLEGATRADTPPWQNIDPLGSGPRSKFILVADNVIGSPDSNATTPGNNGWKAGMTPQNRSANEGIELGIFERNTFIDNPDSIPGADVRLAGRDLVLRTNNTPGLAGVFCSDDAERATALSPSDAQPVEFKNAADCEGIVPPEPNAPGSP